jgi:hypothetical protein
VADDEVVMVNVTVAVVDVADEDGEDGEEEVEEKCPW